MYEDTFAARLTQLRTNKGISAREMSLSIGQNPGYINSIESGKAMPSMTVFFYICDYLKISPQEFFDLEIKQPEKIGLFIKYARKLNDQQLEHVSALIKDITNN